MDPSAYILETFPFYLSLSLSAILYRLVPGRAVKREFECFFFFSFFPLSFICGHSNLGERERKKNYEDDNNPHRRIVVSMYTADV